MSDFNKFIETLSDEQKDKLLEALMSKSNTPDIKDAKKSSTEDFTMKKKEETPFTRRKEPVKARKNQWQDTGEFRDISTPDVERTPRRRDPPRKEDVECHVCGKTFKVDSRYVYGEYYRCNKCGGKK